MRSGLSLRFELKLPIANEVIARLTHKGKRHLTRLSERWVLTFAPFTYRKKAEEQALHVISGFDYTQDVFLLRLPNGLPQPSRPLGN